jgi:DNA-binding CsgD family transcriptional regulator
MDAGDAMPRVFISYAETDIAFAEWLAAGLKARGHHIWLHSEGLPHGVQQLEHIHQALEECDVMLLVMTPTSLKSRLLTNEWMYFLNENHKVLVPILLEPPVPPDKVNFMLAALKHADFSRGDRQVALGALHNSLFEAYATLAENQKPRAAAILPSYRTPSQSLPTDGFEPTSAGLTAIHMGMPLEQFGTWLRRADERVRVLNTWTGVFMDHASALVAAVGRGANVQILLLDPSSAFARQRTLDVYRLADRRGADGNEVPHNIRTSIRQIASLEPEIRAGPGKLELRLYNLLPSFSIHQSDNAVLVGFFPHATRTTTFPMLEIAHESRLGHQIEKEFNQVWESATLVDLERQFAPLTEAANRRLPEPLSARELEILELISAGFSNKEIADRLVVAVATIKKHINSLYSKLSVTSRTRALLRARELGLTYPAPEAL